jgi:LacI family transcriptional regulator
MTRHQEIYQAVRREIASGKYRDGERLPTELELVKRFQVSRPTVARALLDLEAEGLLTRRAGAGTFVRNSGRLQTGAFGLLIPGLGSTEIFEPICAAMARAAQAKQYSLIWGDSPASTGGGAEALCARYVERGVSGVFFAPLEHAPDAPAANRRIVERLETAKIPLVLLDRDLQPFPRRSRHDLVGIDNFAAGCRLAEHLIGLGCRRLAFVSRPGSASTVEARLAGVREAAGRARLPKRALTAIAGDPAEAALIRALPIGRDAALIGANDETAAQLLKGLAARGVAVPRGVRLVGFDDVRYATLLSVPLTTMRQPCEAIGLAAIETMLSRMADPAQPPRELRLEAELVVRRSCGA